MFDFRRHARSGLLIAAAMAMTLTAAACGAPASAPGPAAAPPAPEEPRSVQLVRAAYDNIASAKNYDITFTMRMSSTAAESELTIDGTAAYFLDPAEIRLLTDMTLRVGESAPTRETREQYIFAEDGGLTVFALEDGAWTKSFVASPELSRALALDPADDLRLFMENLRAAELAGEELLNERPAHKIIVRTAGSVLNQLLPAEGEESGRFGAAAAKVFEEAGDLQLTLWVDVETGTLVKLHANLTQFMKKLADATDELTRPDLNAAAEAALKKTLSGVSAELEYTVSNINSAAPFALPLTAAEAKVIAPAPPAAE
ncbi:MAG: hypothetical protein LBL37_03575 [Gracilibacteraceae bacterium]|jgi:hypothetical protein|nr:hypothetical protein [Gracilibacteraceae bacterium]